jgi:hypothetical protein
MSQEIVPEVTQDEVVDAPEIETEQEQETITNDPYANLTPDELKARLKKAEGLIVKNKKDPKPATQPTSNASQPDDVPEWGKQILESNAKRDFQYAHGISPETVDAVFRANGGVMPTAEQMENDEVIKTIVRTFQSKARVAANTPKGGAIPTYKGRTYAEIATDPNASAADKQAAFDATRKKISK